MLPKIVWLREHEPADHSSGRAGSRSPNDFLVHRLTGEIVTDPPNATKYLYDAERRLSGRRCSTALDVDRRRRCRRSSAGGDAVLPLRPRAARAIRAAPTTSGSCSRRTTRSARSTARGWPRSARPATSRARSRASGRSPIDPSATRPAACSRSPHVGDRAATSRAAPTTSAAASIEWAKQVLYPDDPTPYETMVAEAIEAPPGAAGLTFLPYLLGERAPVWDSNARAVFFGLGRNHSRADMIRAIFEGVGYSVLDIADRLAGMGVRSGGYRRRAGWPGSTRSTRSRPTCSACRSRSTEELETTRPGGGPRGRASTSATGTRWRRRPPPACDRRRVFEPDRRADRDVPRLLRHLSRACTSVWPRAVRHPRGPHRPARRGAPDRPVPEREPVSSRRRRGRASARGLCPRPADDGPLRERRPARRRPGRRRLRGTAVSSSAADRSTTTAGGRDVLDALADAGVEVVDHVTVGGRARRRRRARPRRATRRHDTGRDRGHRRWQRPRPGQGGVGPAHARSGSSQLLAGERDGGRRAAGHRPADDRGERRRGRATRRSSSTARAAGSAASVGPGVAGRDALVDPELMAGGAAGRSSPRPGSTRSRTPSRRRPRARRPMRVTVERAGRALRAAARGRAGAPRAARMARPDRWPRRALRGDAHGRQPRDLDDLPAPPPAVPGRGADGDRATRPGWRR